jgi:hypothetical protein
MGRGISENQKKILLLISNMDGEEYFTFLSKIKVTLYSDLWKLSRYSPYAVVINYGSEMSKKSSARVAICKAMHRLKKRGLIETKMTDNTGEMIYLTSLGQLMVNDLLQMTND